MKVNFWESNNCYVILGIAPKASLQEIRSAYGRVRDDLHGVACRWIGGCELGSLRGVAGRNRRLQFDPRKSTRRAWADRCAPGSSADVLPSCRSERTARDSREPVARYHSRGVRDRSVRRSVAREEEGQLFLDTT